MNFKEMAVEELTERRAAIAAELDAPEADLDALEEEARAIKEELELRKADAEKKAEIRAAVADGEGEVTQTVEVEERKVISMEEIRNSKEYIDAYAEYIKTGKDEECRKLVSENGSGTVPVPTLVYDIVKTAWQREGIMSRVRKSYLRGNLKVGFEISGDDAAVHTEGGDAVNEESLTLGIVTLTPKSIKKWISISDEIIDLRGEEFLAYIYDEIAYRIAKKAADTVVAQIVAAGTASTTTTVGVPVVTASSIGLGTVASAMAQLSDEAAEPVVIMNKATWGAFKTAQYGANYAVDPFEGLPVVFNNSLTAYSAATTGVPYAIVGDLNHGALANFPNGEGIDIKYDETTLMTSDLVRILGREYVGIGIVAPNAFVKIIK